jgi:hypothetical protein
MPESTWAEELREAQKEERDHLIKLDLARHRVATIRRAMAEEMMTGDMPPFSGGILPGLNGLPTREAVRELLVWYAKQGKVEVEAGEIFDALKPFQVRAADRRSIWETKNPWKTFASAVGTMNKRLFRVQRSEAAKLMRWDKVSLVTAPPERKFG